MPANVAWPHFVPRIELDEELKLLDTRLQDNSRRLGTCEGRGIQLVATVGALDDRVKDLAEALRGEMAAAESRLAEQLGTLDAKVDGGIRDLREYAAAEVDFAAVRLEHTDRLDQLSRDLAASNRGIEHLDATIKKNLAHSEATFATKRELKDECDKVLCDTTALGAELRAGIDVLDFSKASRVELQRVSEDDCNRAEALQQALVETSSGLARLVAEVEELSTHCDRDLATLAQMNDATRDIESITRRLVDAAEDRSSLRKDVESEKEMARETIFKHQASFRNINDALDRIYELDAHVAELKERCDRNAMDLSSFETGTRTVLDGVLADLHKQSSAHLTLQDTCGQIRTELAAHAGAQKAETDRLAAYSTQLHFDTMDQALGLRQSMQKVEQTHQQRLDSRGIHTVSA